MGSFKTEAAHGQGDRQANRGTSQDHPPYRARRGARFVLVHTPADHTSYALRYRKGDRLVKLTLGTTKALTLADAPKLAAKRRTEVETGQDPHGAKLAARRAVIEREKLDPEHLWEKYMQLAASQLRSRGEKDRLFRRHILPVIGKRCITEVKRAHVLRVVDRLVATGRLRLADKVRQEGAAFFTWLLEREHVDRNVFAGIRKASRHDDPHSSVDR